MNNKEKTKTKSARAQSEIKPALTLVDDGSRILLAVRKVGIMPLIYAFVLRGNPQTGFFMRPETEQYSFKTMDECDWYYQSLRTFMRYQHAKPDVARIVRMYKDDEMDFLARVSALDNSR